MGGTDGGEGSFDPGGIDGVGCFAEEAEEDGAVGAMAEAGEGERAVEMDDDTSGAGELAGGVELLDEAQGGTHGPDGVRAGGSDADLEEFEEAGIHESYCRRGEGGRRWGCDGEVWWSAILGEIPASRMYQANHAFQSS